MGYTDFFPNQDSFGAIWPWTLQNSFFETFLISHPDISDDGSDEQVRSVFQTKQGRKSVDIYWISDDGGETQLPQYA